MNKLINLIIIFCSLQFLIPIILEINKNKNEMIIIFISSLVIGLIQFIYNLGMDISDRKKMSFNDNMLDSMFKSSLIFISTYIFKYKEYIINSLTSTNLDLTQISHNEELYKNFFITCIIMFFMLIKCLITS